MESKTSSSLLDEIIRVKNSKKASKNPQRVKSLATETSHPLLRHIFSKDSLGQKSKKSTESQSQASSQPINYSYSGKTFYFAMHDIELTKTRCQVLAKIIQKRGGRVLKSVQEARMEETVDFMIGNRNLGKKVLKGKVEEQIKIGGWNFRKLVDFNYVIDCQKEGQLKQIEPYILEIEQQTIKNNKEAKKQKQHELGIPIKKVHAQQEKVGFVAGGEATDAQQPEEQFSKTCTCQSQTLSVQRKPSSADFMIKGNIQQIKVQTEKKQPNKTKFACQKGSSKTEFATNQLICQELMKIQSIYENGKDVGRKIAYLKAVSAIRSHNKAIESEKDLAEIRGIGSKISDKIKQLLRTGTIQKLQKLQNCEENAICQELTRVWGVGASKAKQLFEKGIKNIEALRENQDLLNKNQKLGLKYVEEFEQRIPRTKAGDIFEYVKRQLCELVGNPSLHKIEICGSYRRGKESCGDVDIIIARRDGIFQKNLIYDLIFHLEKKGFLTDHLLIPADKNLPHDKSLSYMGVCIFQDEVHHRIDIKYYPLEQFAFATLYFTGSDMFNRSMRLYARKKGYSLSDHGICQVERNSKSERVWTGNSIALYSEKQIFDFLGLEYKSPEERSI